MKNIFMCLAFVIVSAMGETNHQIEKNKIEKHLSEEEKFEMLFGKTTLQFNVIRQARKSRNNRNKRVTHLNRVIVEDKRHVVSTLTQDEKYNMLFGKTFLTKRVARTARFVLPRQARHSLYVTLNF